MPDAPGALNQSCVSKCTLQNRVVEIEIKVRVHQHGRAHVRVNCSDKGPCLGNLLSFCLYERLPACSHAIFLDPFVAAPAHYRCHQAGSRFNRHHILSNRLPASSHHTSVMKCCGSANSQQTNGDQRWHWNCWKGEPNNGNTDMLNAHARARVQTARVGQQEHGDGEGLGQKEQAPLQHAFPESQPWRGCQKCHPIREMCGASQWRMCWYHLRQWQWQQWSWPT